MTCYCDSIDGPLPDCPIHGRPLTVLEWAQERLANSERIALQKVGADRASWLEDVSYWMQIVGALDKLDAAEARVAAIPSFVANLRKKAEYAEHDRKRMEADGNFKYADAEHVTGCVLTWCADEIERLTTEQSGWVLR